MGAKVVPLDAGSSLTKDAERCESGFNEIAVAGMPILSDTKGNMAIFTIERQDHEGMRSRT